MTQYYFVGTVLPRLEIGKPPEMGFVECTQLLRANLTARDWEEVVIVRRFFDVENIRNFLYDAPHDPRGNLDEKALTDAIYTRSGLPDYILDFLDAYPSQEERLRRFSALISAYFREEGERAHGFLKEYLAFERAYRLVMIGFRAKRLGRDLAEELQDEDPYDPLVAQILAQKDAPDYEPPYGYEHLKPLFEANADNPFALFQSATEYRYNHIKGLVGTDAFTITRILGYLIELILVEQWLELDKKKGQEKLGQELKQRGIR